MEDTPGDARGEAPAPHPTSMAAWGVRSPVVAGRRFTAKLGVKCAAGCSLAGWSIVVRDETGAEAGRGRLGETPAPGTSALYAAEVTLEAPAGEGVHAWTVAFDGAGPDPAPSVNAVPAQGASEPQESPPAHATATATLGFRTVRPPEHRVTVMVCKRDTEAPVAGADVRLGIYRGSTGADGAAVIEVRAGSHALYVRKAGYAPHTDRVAVCGDLALRVAMAPPPDTDADEDQIWM